MRSLREAAGEADRDDVWEAFLLDVIPATPMPDFLLYGEPYPALNAVVLTQDEHHELVRLTNVFAGVFEKAVQALVQDVAALERMGFPWVAIELLAHEAAVSGDRPLLLGRFDFMLERDRGWQLLEYNADTPSGARETVVVEALIARHVRRHVAGPLRGTNRRLAGAIRRAFDGALAGETKDLAAPLRPGCRRRTHADSSFGFRVSSANSDGRSPHTPPGARPVLGIVTDAGYAEDLAQAAFLQRLLTGRVPFPGGPKACAPLGYEVVLGDVDNLLLQRGRLYLIDRPLDALYRYYPFETLLGQQAFADLFAAVAAGRLRLLNGLCGLLAQNKGVLAWLWSHRDDRRMFTAAERRAICEHLPAVSWIDEQPLPDETARRHLVLKQVFGREGEEVYFGDRLSDDDWQRCRAWGSYVVQRRVAADALPMVIRTSDGPAARSLWPAVGSFTAAGRWAGYYTRAGDPITSARAKYVATFVE